MKARRRQQIRFAGTEIVANAHMSSKHIDQYIILDEPSRNFIKQASSSLNLSPRVIHRTLKLARTIADMEEVDDIGIKHIAEALQYRNKTMFVE
jgi:magnesium chelatase family protein